MRQPIKNSGARRTAARLDIDEPEAPPEDVAHITECWNDWIGECTAFVQSKMLTACTVKLDKVDEYWFVHLSISGSGWKVWRGRQTHSMKLQDAMEAALELETAVAALGAKVLTLNEGVRT